MPIAFRHIILPKPEVNHSKLDAQHTPAWPLWLCGQPLDACLRI